MSRLFIILIAIGAFFTWMRWRKLTSQQARRDFIYKGLVFGLLMVIIGLAVFGRIDALGAIFASLLLSIKFIIAFAIRNFPIIARIYGVTGGFGLGRKRTLRTQWLEVSIDFSSKKISGNVLKGQFKERYLDDMSQPELESFLQECKEDAKSAYLLQTYINQRFNQSSGSYSSGSYSSDSQNPSATSMSNDEALEILGLEGSPSQEEIKLAHKKLMQKLHPDRGGNDFLASLLNRARDQLIDKE